MPNDDRPGPVRGRSVAALRVIEQVLYVAVALALALAGAILFVSTLVTFAAGVGDSSLARNVLGLLDGLLLVFIVTELIHTVHSVIRENVLLTEPFLIVGIVAAIRRLIVISAEASEVVGTTAFDDLMVEMGVLVGAIVLLGFTIFLVRRTQQAEPRPAHEPSGRPEEEGQ